MSNTTPSLDVSATSRVGVTNIKDAISNKSEGGSGGTSFTLVKQEYAVLKIKVWTDKGSGNYSDRQLIKDIQLTWDNGASEYITGNHSGNSANFDFNDNEKVTQMIIRAGDKVDKISFTTDKEKDGTLRSFSAGDENGSPCPQQLGVGIFVGFHGTYDPVNKELNSLGADFSN
ncbi:hypothetical protein N0V90_001068 [Kalmusia sp. IMI 367209]|nr:hypothetical protein N0V90_001068 [Kalmusia sp. IMI 367209]